MKLRQGKTRNIIESSIDSALLAVEIYNKPRTSFRREGYISLMVISWTKLFHAFFNHNIGNKYYYKEKNGRYKTYSGDRKTWELGKCIKEYNKGPHPLSPAVEANLRFFINLRHKIEHRHLTRPEIDTVLFGEYQSLLYNYESMITAIFGNEYSLNENLSFSLQFSKLRTKEQDQANREVLSKDVVEIKEFVEKYRLSLPDEVYSSQEYSIKLIQIPKISNTNRNDLAVEFVNWNELSEEDKVNYTKLTALIKDKVIKKEAINVGRLKAGEVIEKVSKLIGKKFSHHDHLQTYYIFSIRPTALDKLSPFETNTKYCLYDEAHNDYLYQDGWVIFVANLFLKHKLKHDDIKSLYKKSTKLSIDDYQ